MNNWGRYLPNVTEGKVSSRHPDGQVGAMAGIGMTGEPMSSRCGEDNSGQ